MCNPSGSHLSFRSRLVWRIDTINFSWNTNVDKNTYLLHIIFHSFSLSPLFGNLFLVVFSHTSSAKTKKIQLFPHLRMWNYFKLFNIELSSKIRIGRSCTKKNKKYVGNGFLLENWYYSVYWIYWIVVCFFIDQQNCEVFIELTHLSYRSSRFLNG